MYDLGARYVTTTHNCDNAFRTAASSVAAGGEDRELTPFGHKYVTEMNRLGMMIDLSYVSHQTMRCTFDYESTGHLFTLWSIFSTTASSPCSG